jgi:cell pole-organizing protein PopZ
MSKGSHLFCPRGNVGDQHWRADAQRDGAVGGGTTLEEIVAQMMKPMLAAWLDEHLPEIVERVVQQEVERAARGGGGRRR